MSQNPQERPLPMPASFTGDEAGPFDLDQAALWTATYRKQNPEQTRAHFFGRNILEKILAQPDCMGLRIYYAIDPESNERHLLVVGADAKQNDQLPSSGEPSIKGIGTPETTQTEDGPGGGIIAEASIPCPNQCSQANPLNSL